MDLNPLIKTYPDIGEHAFGYKGRAIASLFIYLELYLVAVEFLMLEGDNLNKLFPNMGFKVAGVKIGGRQAFVLLTSHVVLPTTWLKSLGMLAYVFAGGVLASFILVVCIFWVGAVNEVGFHESNVLLNWREMPTAICMFTFCYHGQSVFHTLCNSMKDRSRFFKARNNILDFYLETISCKICLGFYQFYLSASSQAPSAMDQWLFQAT
ncbi:hypothetical protein QUC31_013533 [Theobroma cacao]